MEHGVRFSSEADSLNFSVLGVDVAPGSAEFDLYVRQLVTEMTSKAGQKCTAIRRALVPDALVPAVIDAVQARIADKVRVGDPTAAGVTMGALVGLAQRDDVRKNLAELAGGRGRRDRRPGPFRGRSAPTRSAARSCRRCCCGPRIPAATSRTTSRCSGRSAPSWATGTPSTPSSWPRVAGAAWSAPWSPPIPRWSGTWSWASRPGTAGCWCSIRTPRPSPPVTAPRCRTWCTAGPAAPATARSSAASAGCCTTCSAPPSRVRPTAVSAVTGTWVTGAPRNTEGKHPFRKSLAELRVGDAVVAGPRTITLDDIEAFADLSGDRFYAHMDEQAAAASPFFDGRVAHGYFVVSLAAGLFVSPDTARCWPTTGWRTCGSPPRSTRATR